MSGLAIKTLGSSIIFAPENPVASDFCPCDFWCEWEEKVFADPAASGYAWRSDMSDFLFKKVTSADTLTITLEKGGILVATITDSTYGTYYSSFAAQPLYVGWVADWTLIFNAFSGGQYQVKVEGTLAGSSFSWESRKFRLCKWHEEAAHKTVKIESYQSGVIMSSEFDFTGLISGGWYSSIRINGQFGNKAPSLEVDEYLDTSYKSVQNRTKVNYQYSLFTHHIPASILHEFSGKDLIGNEVFITDYSLMSSLKYQRIPVVTDSFEEVTHNDLYNGRDKYSILFTERTPNTIKRNY